MSKDKRPLNDEELSGFIAEIEWAFKRNDVEYGLHEAKSLVDWYKELRDQKGTENKQTKSDAERLFNILNEVAWYKLISSTPITLYRGVEKLFKGNREFLEECHERYYTK